MIEDKAIKLEPGDYILEYDTQKVARVELINMVEGLCDRGIRLWLVRSRGGDALRIVPKETSTTKTTEPMSFEPGDSVLEYITINNIKYLPEVPPKKEHVTPEPFQQVQNVTQGKPGCNPKLYLTAEGMRVYDGSKWV